VESSPALAVVLPGFSVVEVLRYVFPCSSRWEKVALLLMIKLFRLGLLSADGCSGAFRGGHGKRENSSFGRVADATSVPDLGVSRLGAGCLAILPPLVRLLAARCGGMVLGFVIGWWVVLRICLVAGRRVVQGHGQRSTGRVPGRCPFSVKIY